jgi:membrane-associated HD superfamily phosphohydrolase
MFTDIFITITASLCMYVNFKKSTASDRNKILWLFWGLISFTFLIIIHAIVYYLSFDALQTVSLLFNILMVCVLAVSLFMSLFYADTFDTGILIRRTFVNGFIFILIVLIYNTLEHYFLHWLAHELHLSDVLLSSLLSGILVLAFSPLHHRLMHFLEKYIKNKTQDVVKG